MNPNWIFGIALAVLVALALLDNRGPCIDEIETRQGWQCLSYGDNR